MQTLPSGTPLACRSDPFPHPLAMVPLCISPLAVPARAMLSIAALLGAASALGAQRPARPDSVRADSARRPVTDSSGVQTLPGVTVTVALTDQTLARVPWAVGIVGTRELRRGQPTTGFDEALSGIPGVLVGNRYNYALDQRIAVRGFGSRANFGVRGVKILLDGIPQTLPDGQSQITNIELGAMERVEVLRGAASALYGNGSGGVIAFTSDMRAPEPFRQTVRVEGGADGLLKWQARTAGRTERVAGTLSLSQLTWDGFRPHNSADVRQLNAGVDYAFTPATVGSLRLNVARMPEALNPGALTAAEFAANPDSAAVNNVLRGADKRTDQDQLSLRLRRQPGASGVEIDASAFALTRDLRNAIAAAPPAPAGPSNGTYITLDREVYGARLSAARDLGAAGAPRLTLGTEWQRMEDVRENFRSTGGRPTAPTDTLLLSQLETVWNASAFAQLAWSPTERVTLSAGGRYDRIRFEVDDRFLSDGENSGGRALPAWSGHLGASVVVDSAFVPYANLSTSFETPTTTELQARADGLGGFNDDLSPQRAVSGEVGARGVLLGGHVSYSAALFRANVTDAIVQYLELSGRAFFTNAGETHNTGAEVSLGLRASEALGLDVAYTWSRYRFADYLIVEGTEETRLDGNTLPGVPEHFLRLGLRTRPLRDATFDVDHTVSSAQWANDANTVRVEGWGPGVTNARATWNVLAGRQIVQPFVGVTNLFDRRYVASIVVNGFGGRVREPGPGRSWYVGMELGWASAMGSDE